MKKNTPTDTVLAVEGVRCDRHYLHRTVKNIPCDHPSMQPMENFWTGKTPDIPPSLNLLITMK